MTGNTVIDALLIVAEQPYDVTRGPLAEIPWDKCITLATAHRRESFGEPLQNICLALRELAERYADRVHVVFPVHMNPHVRQVVHATLGGVANVTLLPPLDYLPFVHLMKNSYLILTDSGGIQEEAPSLGVPVLVLRDTTERPEAVAAGTARLVGTVRDRIVSEARLLLDDAEARAAMARAVNPYGDGRASQRIVQCIGEAVE